MFTRFSQAHHQRFTGSTQRPPSLVSDERFGSRALTDRHLEILAGEFQVLADGKRVGLTVREFQTFLVLAERPDRVVTRPEIYAQVWGGQMAYRDRSVDVFVRKVRRKLKACAPGWSYIHTHFGVGYRLTPERVTSV